jgi:hypothetical protein
MSGARRVLEFYSVRIARSRFVRGRGLVFLVQLPMNSLRLCALTLLAFVAGCASVPPTPPPASTPATPSAPAKPAPYVEPPPPPVNLQGFPPTYRLGFGDGCATGRGTEKKDPVRFSNDGNYRVGWQDGLAQCRRQ